MKIRKGTGVALEIIGRLKEIPEIRKTSNDTLVTNITLAVDSVRKNEETGEPENYTEWCNVTVWGRSAQFIKEKTHAGMRLYLEATVVHEKETVKGKDGKKYVFYIPKFHTNEIQPMDAINTDKTDKTEMANESNNESDK